MSSKRILLLLVMVSFIITAGSDLAAEANELNKKVVAEVNGEEITFGELSKAYKKNLNREELKLHNIDHDSLMSFLDLYVNYRLKVQDALDQNYDNNMEVMEDIKSNRKMLAESFFYDSRLIEPQVNRLVDMRKEEFLISIIIFKADQTGDAQSNQRTLTHANKILDSIKKVGKFEYFAKTYSQDPTTAPNGGRIPTWITSGKVQRQMEDVVYSLQTGEVYPEVVKTNFGYFIIKVNKRVPRIFVLAGHILIQNVGEVDSVTYKRQADSISAIVHANGNFEEMAKLHSSDKNTGVNGGSFGEYYSRSTGFEKNGRNMLTEITESIFSLKDNEISEPVKSMIGYSIVKRLKTKDVELANERTGIKKIYKKLYLEKDKRDLLDKLKKEYGFTINEEIKQHFLSSVDNSRTNLDSAWDAKLDKDLYDEVFFEVKDVKYTLVQFLSDLKKRSDLRGTALNEAGLQSAIDKIIDPEIFYIATKDLEKDNQEFADLMNEFRDGILLFKVEAERVWDKLKFDSTIAKQYFDTTSREFMRPTMYDLTEVYVLDTDIADSVYLAIEKGANIEELAAEKTVRYGFREKNGKWGLVSSTRNKLGKIVAEKGLKAGEVSRPFENESGFSVVKVNSVMPPRKMTFEEAIPDLAPMVQDLLQEKLTREWLEELKDKFDVEIHDEVIKETVSELKGK
jgi:peptidyl-prolyl cis-trans isomerase SurA